jgi:uncharacterized membrane protein YcjF (UPF0283 family)
MSDSNVTNAAVFWHCFVASLGDGVIVLLIVVVGWISFQRWEWFERPAVAGYLLMLLAGLILAVLVEWVGVHRLARWEYTDKMPNHPLGWHRSYPGRANGHSSAGDIPHGGSLVIKQKVTNAYYRNHALGHLLLG